MLDFTFCIYIVLSLFNLFFDKNKNIWIIVLLYFVIKQFVFCHDPIQYLLIEYILQIVLLSICALLFSYGHNGLRCYICLILVFISFINIFVYLYPSLSEDIFHIFYSLSDRIYYEIVLVLAVYSESNKLIQNILTLIVSLSLGLTYIF